MTREGDLSAVAWYHLYQYLLAHEDDIAHGINDFDYLRLVFKEVVDREAEKPYSPQRQPNDR